MEKDNNLEQNLDKSNKKLHISDVISRFSFRDGDEETENKIIRYVELRGMLRTHTMGFVNTKEFQDNYFEMEELRRWIGQI
jgi:hypothetical protein